jgi:hypothetical protein
MFGHRLLGKNQKEDATAMFKTELDDAPDGSDLEDLAQDEIDRLGE